MSENEKPIEQAAEQKPEAPKKERRRTLTERLYNQIDILEAEQAKITAIDGSDTNTRAVRSERLAFSTQITETANAIINIKRRDK
jgi:hypothetical protein